MVKHHMINDKTLHVIEVRVGDYYYDVHVQLGHVTVIPVGSKTKFDEYDTIKSIEVSKNVNS